MPRLRSVPPPGPRPVGGRGRRAARGTARRRPPATLAGGAQRFGRRSRPPSTPAVHAARTACAVEGHAAARPRQIIVARRAPSVHLPEGMNLPVPATWAAGPVGGSNRRRHTEPTTHVSSASRTFRPDVPGGRSQVPRHTIRSPYSRRTRLDAICVTSDGAGTRGRRPAEAPARPLGRAGGDTQWSLEIRRATRSAVDSAWWPGAGADGHWALSAHWLS